MADSYDAIVIGSGQAGPFLANRLTEAGMRVALVERHLFGGTCVNTGCIPPRPWWRAPTWRIWPAAAPISGSPSEAP
jgi:pyruvate/2-oxoglutarate dehydrogenase complex dihydrolipoamide dehydrogenase (E3) component